MLISAIKSSVSSFFNGILMHRNKNKNYFINKWFMRKSSFLFCILSRTLWKLEIKFFWLSSPVGNQRLSKAGKIIVIQWHNKRNKIKWLLSV